MLFERVVFSSHVGLDLDWKIECDALTPHDWGTLAWLVAERFTFGSVLGVPRGGLAFAEALESYSTTGPILVVDDVLTTGTSMEEYHQHPSDIGVVVFARGPCPDWVTPIFSLTL